MLSEQRIPVTVIGGYLGAGKTTLVNYVLRTSGERIAVIVNDFGEISIDEDLIVAAEGDKLTLANGCICCTLADGFAAALMQVRSAGTPPARLLIEASGVADPAQVAAYGHTPGLRLDAVVVLADAEQVRRLANDRWVADTVRGQLGAADLLVLNKIDLLASDDDADELCNWLRAVAPGAALVRARHAAVPSNVLFDTSAEALDGTDPGTSKLEGPRASGATAAGHAHEHAADLFESQTVTLDEPVPSARIRDLLDNVPDGVARLKGLVRVTEGDGSHDAPSSVADWVIEAVGTRTSMTPSEPHRRWVISVIAHKGSLPVDWLVDRLAGHD